MTNAQFKKLLSEASASTRAVNNPRKNPIMERVTRNAALGAIEAQEADSSRVHISIVSVRKRLLDPDNLSVKWLIDCLRYIRAIQGDEPDKITLQVSQRKAGKGEEERTEIEIIYPNITPL